MHKPIWCSQCDLFPILPAPSTVEKAEYGVFICTCEKKINKQQKERFCQSECSQCFTVSSKNTSFPELKLRPEVCLFFPRACWIIVLNKHRRSQERDCWVCRDESCLLLLGVLALQNRSKDWTQASTPRSNWLSPSLGLVCCGFGLQALQSCSNNRNIYAFAPTAS